MRIVSSRCLRATQCLNYCPRQDIILGIVAKEERLGHGLEGVPGTSQPKFSVDTWTSPRCLCFPAHHLPVREALPLSLTEEYFSWASVWREKAVLGRGGSLSLCCAQEQRWRRSQMRACGRPGFGTAGAGDTPRAWMGNSVRLIYGPGGEVPLSSRGEETELPLWAEPMGARVHTCLWKELSIPLGLVARPAQTCLRQRLGEGLCGSRSHGGHHLCPGRHSQVQHTLPGLAVCTHVSVNGSPLGLKAPK